MISIIIPAYNEAAEIGGLLDYLHENGKGYSFEIIVVDGGSADDTIEVCRNKGVKVVQSPEKGRAKQMNYGASKAQGSCLYFLHADTMPPPSYLSDLATYLNQGIESGCYRLQFNSDHLILKAYAWFTRFDIDLFRFGDQSLFVKKEVFEAAGRFDTDLIVMEDQEIISRLKEQGRFKIIPKAVSTSARKYEQIGVIKLQLIFSLIMMLYYLGVSQTTIEHFYKNALN